MVGSEAGVGNGGAGGGATEVRGRRRDYGWKSGSRGLSVPT